MAAVQLLNPTGLGQSYVKMKTPTRTRKILVRVFCSRILPETAAKDLVPIEPNEEKTYFHNPLSATLERPNQVIPQVVVAIFMTHQGESRGHSSKATAAWQTSIRFSCPSSLEGELGVKHGMPTALISGLALAIPKTVMAQHVDVNPGEMTVGVI